MKKLILLAAFSVFPLGVAFAAPRYTAEKTTDHGIEIVRLADTTNGVVVKIAPSVGNRLYEMKVHGKDVLNTGPEDPADFRKTIGSGGIPFLAPWANRLGEKGFWANGKDYTFNMTLGNVRGGDVPIHGLLNNSSLWELVEFKADGHSAYIKSKLTFWKYPDLMANWPFAHEYVMTYRLSGGVLEVQLDVTNLSTEPMPMALGFHPCFSVPDADRDQWSATIAATKMVVADKNLVSTGELKPIPMPSSTFMVKDYSLDTGFTDFQRDAEGKAHFSLTAGGKTVEEIFGPKYPAAQIYIPPGRQTVCIEPMAGITNSPNLNHQGKYPSLQSVAPGTTWTESFWIRSSGI
jgi:aldose 1-epimerase